jgi:23S rRNA (cytidine1920-2'-O)/16S rRNA (cytidine1409-2'-O)-methyltransferase
MARRNRLDTELVRRGLAGSTQEAGDLVAAGRVEVRGTRATKAAAMVDPAEAVRVVDAVGEGFVSRGAHKLAGALAAFAPLGLTVPGRRCLDAGASTGGFTDLLLREGAAAVAAVDVGYGQLAWPLRNDSRVTVLERTNVRTLTPQAIGGPVDLTVADLSFISLRSVLPALADCTAADGDLVPMVKPQFEVERALVGAGGVVRDAGVRADAVLAVASAAAALGLGVAGTVASPLPGPSGNVEFFLWLRRGAPPADEAAIRAIAARASAADPSSQHHAADGEHDADGQHHTADGEHAADGEHGAAASRRRAANPVRPYHAAVSIPAPQTDAGGEP